MSHYKLLLEVDTTIRDGKVTDLIVPIDSLEQNLVEIINQNVVDYHTISFDKYYEDSPLMLWSKCFPYIKKNGVFKWSIPYSEVTISDFLETQNLKIYDRIKVHIDNFGGSGDGLSTIMILSWLLMLMNGFNSTVDFATNSKRLFGTITSSFKSRQKLVSLHNVKEAVRKNNKWSTAELQKALDTNDEIIIQSLMQWCGFLKQGDEYLIGKDTIHLETLQNKYWGKGQNIYSYSTLEQNRINLNQNLAILRWISDDQTSALCEFAEHATDTLIANNEEYLKNGTGLNYIEITTSYQNAHHCFNSDINFESSDDYTNNVEINQLYGIISMTEEMIQFILKTKYGLEPDPIAFG